MLPHVDLPEIVLEVMQQVPAFTSVSGGTSRLKGLNISVAACLTAQALNVGYGLPSTR